MILLLLGLLAGPMQSAEPVGVEPVSKRVSIVVPSGRCRIVLNDQPVTLARLRKEAKGWRKTQPEVHFMPEIDAEYRCVDQVLRILREAHVTKLGFVGNEQAPEGAQ